MTSMSAVAFIVKLVDCSDDPCSFVTVFPSYWYTYVVPAAYWNFVLSDRDSKVKLK